MALVIQMNYILTEYIQSWKSIFIAKVIVINQCCKIEKSVANARDIAKRDARDCSVLDTTCL